MAAYYENQPLNIDYGSSIISYDVYVPEGANSSTPVQIIIPGSGGNVNATDNDALQEYLSNNNPNSIVVIPNFLNVGTTGYCAENYDSVINGIMSNVLTTYGGDSSNTSIFGFSAGVTSAIISGSRSHAGNSPYKASNIIAIDCDTWYRPEDAYGEEALQRLVDDNVTLYSFNQNWKGINDFSYADIFADAGVNTIVIETQGIHMQNCYNVYANGMIDFLNGDGYLTGYGTIFNAKHKVNGEWVPMSEEEFRNSVNSSLFGKLISNLKRITSFDTVESNEPLLNEFINPIHNLIKNSSLISASQNAASEFVSTTNVPTSEPSILCNYYLAIESLLENLVNDTNSILELGSSITELDQKLSDVLASNLSEGTDVSSVMNTYTSPTSWAKTSDIFSVIKDWLNIGKNE